MPGRRFLRRAATALGILLAGAGLWQLGAAGTIHAKAWLAQVLLSGFLERHARSPTACGFVFLGLP